jgi:hypothetical protein
MREREIFMAALDITEPERRAAYLDASCAGDEALRLRVIALLRRHDDGGSFLEQPVLAQGALGSTQPGAMTGLGKGPAR